ncbi:non-reducing polyketide synthase pyr2 [Aspergillus clavatus NRRL 1]|uniref:Polyketide synthase, putative n=1 Tax=Aspergillus clavatus (strain ATCC 1007 / CBS 513.65 / DSM 816 / NCTC 3887 / NRRL 1 / QM 1276 / 107) TaxID=344612 RepID=A1CLJ5_ASPCL|nr:polyketide synthase, putative [Aspergillus clavatus NRRL 1]EAW10019.1 polyketide synthase, putative [Aspergillus clavatus NRRL 1]
MKPTEPVAIIGTGCRFPGSASSPAKLWELLRNPRDLARKIPSDRFNIDAFYHPDGEYHGRTNVQQSYFLDEDVRAFDAAFFNISPAEAAAMDPQQRLLLETVYESLDAAGLRMDALHGSMTGVFCGTLRNDYSQLQAMDPQAFPAYVVTGNSLSIMANRVSYYFDWRGPSMAVDTGCSSSLLAVHLAVEALAQDDCSMAVAVGSNLILSPGPYIADSKTHMLSPTGRSRMWDKSADGYARGEGIASVVLKRLRDAINDGDPIECVIRATGANSDGRTMGITMPSAHAQQMLIRATYARAGLSPQERPEDRCQYFEAHGTGTQAGDPQEATAIHGSFFGLDSVADIAGPLYVGSIKTIIGHTEATAGLAGLIKASLSLQHGLIVPNLLMNELNPKIVPFAGQLSVPTECIPWPALPAGCPRRASVNSFGFGGANVHVILESYNHGDALLSRNRGFAVPLVFSAASERTLTAVLGSYVQFLQDHAEINLVDLALSLWTKRSAHNHRLTLMAQSVAELQDLLATQLHRRTAGTPSSLISRPGSRRKRVLGIFTGQGVQWPQMGFDLIDSSPEIRRWMDELQGALDQLPSTYAPGFSLVEHLSRPPCSSRVHEGLMSLPLRTAVQIIQANLLRRVGIDISVAVGHSSGEIVAAYAAGMLTAPDAIRIAYLRGKAISEARDATGRMMAVSLTWEQAQAICAAEPYSGRIAVAAANSPSSVTLSGEAECLRELEWLLKSLGLTPRMLRVDTAYHSPHMKPCADPYRQAMHAYPATTLKGRTPWFSSVYPGINMMVYDQHDLTNEYWVQNMLLPVQFYQAVETALQETGPPDLIVEIGPHPTLKGPVLQTLSHVFPAQSTVPYLALAERGKGGFDSWAAALGTAWMHLGPTTVHLADYLSVFEPEQSTSLTKLLPLYPFDHSQTYWAQSRLSRDYVNCPIPPNALLGTLSAETGLGESRWRNYFRLQELPWLAERRIKSEVMFPEMGYVSMALEAGLSVAKTDGVRLLEVTDMAIHTSLPVVDDPIGTEVLTIVTGIASRDGIIEARCSVQSVVAGELVECATANICMHSGATKQSLLPPRGALDPAMRPVETTGFYDILRRRDYHCTGSFAGLTKLLRHYDLALGTVSTPPRDPNGHINLHPTVLETSVQTLIAALGEFDDDMMSCPLLVRSIHSVWVNPVLCLPRGEEQQIELVGFITQVDEEGIHGDIDIFTPDGEKIAQLEGVRLMRAVSEDVDRNLGIFSTTEWGPLEPTLEVLIDPLPPNISPSNPFRERLPVLHLQRSELVAMVPEQQHRDYLLINLVGWMNNSTLRARKGYQAMSSRDWLDMNGERLTARIRTHIEEYVGLSDNDAVCDAAETGELPRTDHGDCHLKNDPLFCHLVGSILSLAGHACFRFPHMDILQIGTLGISTHCMLKKMGLSYRSFTYGAPSTVRDDTGLENQAEAAPDVQDKRLDFDQNLAGQGFLDHSYEILLYTAVDLPEKNIVVHLKRLLKPGGYLLVLVRVSPRHALDSEAPPPCEGIDHGQCHCHTIDNFADWYDVLSACGFGDVEGLEVGQGENNIPLGFALILCRGPDTQKTTSPRYGELMLLGGSDEGQQSLLSELTALVDGQFGRVSRVQGLKSIESSDNTDLTVVGLLDDWSFSSIDVQDLQRLVQTSTRVLCVTLERDNQHDAGLIRGLLRSLTALKNSSCLVQLLTITEEASLSASVLAAALERFIKDTHVRQISGSSGLNCVEPEIQYDGSRLYIPRQIQDHWQNKAHLASRQRVTELVHLGQAVIKVVPGATNMPNPQFRVLSTGQPPVIAGYGPTVQVSVRYSTLSAVRVADGIFLYLAIGQEDPSDQRIMALSPHNASQLNVPKSWVWPVAPTVAEAEEPSLLHTTAAVLSAGYLIDQVHSTETLLVHDPDPFTRDILTTLAVRRNINVVFSTSENTSASDKSTLFLHRRSTARQLAQVLPPGIAAVAALNRHQDPIVERMISLLPAGTKQTRLDDLYPVSPSIVPVSGENIQRVAMGLMTASLLAQNCLEKSSSSSMSSVPINHLAEEKVAELEHGILDWACATPLRAQISSASSMLQLSGTKTYLVLGITGDMAQVVCHSLVQHGAKWIFWASADKPESTPTWFEEICRRGVRIAHSTIRLTEYTALQNLDHTIPRFFPRTVGGVLIKPELPVDCVFSQLTNRLLQEHLSPCVRTIEMLDTLHETPDIDFWVLTGSIPGTLCDPNQSMTVAMADIMATLVRQRRSRGRPASLVHLGEVMTVGKLSKEVDGWWGSTVVSRRDVDEILAQAILHGRADSTQNPEFVAGLRYQRSAKQYPSCSLPRMWPLFSSTAAPTGNTSSGEHKLQSSKERVAAATSPEDKAQAIAIGLVEKIRTKLNLSQDAPLTPDTLLPELGVDSLVAVELRRWFSKEVGVDIPVISLLSGASIGQLAALAASKRCKDSSS